MVITCSCQCFAVCWETSSLSSLLCGAARLHDYQKPSKETVHWGIWKKCFWRNTARVCSMSLNLPYVHLIASCLCINHLFSSAKKTCLLVWAAHVPSCVGQRKPRTLSEQPWFEKPDLYLMFEDIFWNIFTFCLFRSGHCFLFWEGFSSSSTLPFRG